MKQIRENDKKGIQKKKLEIKVAPEFMNLFQKSETMSSKSLSTFRNIGEKGRFGKLLAPGRKRKFWEIERDDKCNLVHSLENQLEKRDKAIKKMEKQIKEFEAEKIVYFETQEKLDKLYQLGVIGSGGDYIPFNPDEEEKDME